MAYVLIIEPNTLLSGLYAQALSHAGFKVDAVKTAQAAINAADGNTPDVIIMELQLPEHNGVEFLHELRSYGEWKQIPVIVQTAIPLPRIGSAVDVMQRELGVTNVLYKPNTTLTTLIAAVQTQLDKMGIA